MSVINYFNRFEKYLWLSSVSAIIASYIIGEGFHTLSLIASLIGVTALIFLAKGNMLGQLLTVIFSLLYGIISFDLSYYGEMITYLGMTAPAAVVAMVAWIKNPYHNNKREVAVANLNRKKITIICILTIVVTTAFFFILSFFDTAYLYLSTLSVATSFIAVSLTYYRSEYYATAYAVNDIVLIVLWSLATLKNIAYLTMVICFAVFLVNDMYGFINWRRMKLRQQTLTKK